MTTNRLRQVASFLLLVVALAVAVPGASSTAASGISPSAQFTQAQMLLESGPSTQIAALEAQGNFHDAALIRALAAVPRGFWLVGGQPEDVEAYVAEIMAQASATSSVPILVAYNIPGRDCAEYSAGGATNSLAYAAWVDAVARGIGNGQVVVILEPDSLGLLPSDCGGPNVNYPFTDADRYAELIDALDTFTALPAASVYLDGTHSAWLSVGDVALRLATAHVERAQGFFLNVSNFQSTQNLITYGTWISKCLAFAKNPADGGWRLGHYELCASQYWPANANDFSSWALSDAWYDTNLGAVTATAHFVIDSGRNGRGPWTAPANHPAGDPQEWCNPPGRGTGIATTAVTDVPLLDAYLWIKPPGESDGGCFRWTGGPHDPVRNMADPAAGSWFDTMALELATNAQPNLEPLLSSIASAGGSTIPSFVGSTIPSFTG